jgi:Mce-associated membrane protein
VSADVAIGAVALAVVALTLLAVIGQRLGSQTASNHRQGSAAAATYLAGSTAHEAQAAAVREVTATLTYNYKTLHADFTKAEAGLTPKFRTTYEQTTADSVTPLATKYHAISSADVAASGVSAVTANSATVLLFVDQTVQNTQLAAKERLDRSRIKATMVKLDGKWLIDDLLPL